MMKSSEKYNWENFWTEKQNVQNVYSNSERIRINLKKITDLNLKKILEIGAGTGRDSLYMINDGCELYLLDYAKKSLEIINTIKPKDAPVYAIGADTFRLPFQDSTFDIVFHQGLLEHFRPDAASSLLRENIRILKKGGLLLVDVPQRYHVYTLIKHILIFLNAWFAGWEREFSLHELCNELTSLGLTSVHSYGEWMYPSLFYRMIREALIKIGITLPLKPQSISILTDIRASIRTALTNSFIQKNTALSIGVIAQK